MDMMNQEIKNLWLEALRSGNYEQGRGSLHRVDSLGKESYCCLGVLCDLANKAGVVEVAVPLNCPCGSTSCSGPRISYDGEVAFIPASVENWAGLTSENPEVEYEDDEDHDEGYFTLAHLNDDARLTFLQIADLVEAQL